MLKISTDPFSSKKMVSHFVSVSQRIKSQFFRNAEYFLLSFWVFGTAHSTALTINVSTQLEIGFVRKKKRKLSNIRTSSCNKIMFSITELAHNWRPAKLKQGSELVLNDSANVRSVIAMRAFYVLVLVFTDFRSLVCFLHRITYIFTMQHGPNHNMKYNCTNFRCLVLHEHTKYSYK
jgi:hypothetical protein